MKNIRSLSIMLVPLPGISTNVFNGQLKRIKSFAAVGTTAGFLSKATRNPIFQSYP
jgi:hypothetical protein